MTWLRSHVERCLQDLWDRRDIGADGDGDYPFRWGSAACFVRVEPGDPPLVRVWAQAAVGVKRSAKLLAELNDVNQRTRTAHAFYADHLVVVEQPVHAGAVDRVTLQQACESVGTVADDIGTMIAAVHGGHTPFPHEDATLDEQAS